MVTNTLDSAGYICFSLRITDIMNEYIKILYFINIYLYKFRHIERSIRKYGYFAYLISFFKVPSMLVFQLQGIKGKVL